MSALTRRHGRAGWTALMIAVHFSHWEEAQYLLELGLPAKHRAPDGTTLSSILDSVEAMTRGSGQKPEPGFIAFKGNL